MTLRDAEIGLEYVIKEICTEDEELNAFLFSLGCYSGEPITVISRKRSGLVVSIKDGRYNLDGELAAAIEISAMDGESDQVGEYASTIDISLKGREYYQAG